MPDYSWTPDYLAIGHLCHDVAGDTFVPGGTAAYTSLTARQFGLKSAIVTSVGEDFLFHSLFSSQQIEVHHVPASGTTVFENRYEKGERIQYLRQRAESLTPAHIPPAWKSARIVQFSPIADEIDFRLLSFFPDALLGATIQGWLRKWDESGLITPKEMPWEALEPVHIVIFSEDDIRGFETALPILRERVNTMVVTRGRNGADLYRGGTVEHYPAFPVTEVDPTGAGDVFSASFLIRFQAERSPEEAMAFAHAAASIIVEGNGISNLPKPGEVEERCEKYKRLFF